MMFKATPITHVFGGFEIYISACWRRGVSAHTDGCRSWDGIDYFVLLDSISAHRSHLCQGSSDRRGIRSMYENACWEAVGKSCGMGYAEVIALATGSENI